MNCIDCQSYRENYCKTYDEVTRPDNEVLCIGFDPRETCGGCCYYDSGHCEFYGSDRKPSTAACEAWEPKIEL